MSRDWRFTHQVALCVAVLLSATLARGQSPSPDLSDPERAFDVLRRAYSDRDAEAIALSTYCPGTDDRVTPSAKKQSVEQGLRQGQPAIDAFAQVFERLSLRSVVPAPDLLSKRTNPTDYTEAVRVLCSFRNDPVVLTPDGPHTTHVFAIPLVRREGRWQLYVTLMPMWDHWSYDMSTPDRACRSVMMAIGRRDVVGVTDMIDPSLLAAVERSRFLSESQRRLETIAEWKASRETVEQEARAAKRPVPKAPPAPFVARDPHWDSNKLEVEHVTEGTTKLARVWRVDPNGKRVRCEIFVQLDERWYWRPKPEYTAWPLKTDQPTTQPSGG